MPTYINIGGKLCVNVEGFGYISVSEYLALQQLEEMELERGGELPVGKCRGCDKKLPLEDIFCSSCNKKCNCMRIAETNPKFLSKEKVLEIFVLYVKKNQNGYSVFDIPIGKKYTSYSGFIQKELKGFFPDIKWSLLHEGKTTFTCRGEKSETNTPPQRKAPL